MTRIKKERVSGQDKARQHGEVVDVCDISLAYNIVLVNQILFGTPKYPAVAT